MRYIARGDELYFEFVGDLDCEVAHLVPGFLFLLDDDNGLFLGGLLFGEEQGEGGGVLGVDGGEGEGEGFVGVGWELVDAVAVDGEFEGGVGGEAGGGF